MAINPYDACLEEKVLSADPVELVRMLYAGAVEAVERARRHLATNQYRDRAAAISKAVAILVELDNALNHQPAPEVSRRLAELYDYMERRLLEANFEQTDAPLVSVLEQLAPLAEAWNAVPLLRLPDRSPIPAAGREWNPPAAPSAGEPVHGWSF